MLKHKSTILLFSVLAGLYLATRLINLTILPIFTDEAIYIRWSQIALADQHHRFISLSDGKQPLFIWFNMLTLKAFADPLVAGRMVSIFAGLASLAGIVWLTWRLFNQQAAVFAGLLYIISPFSLFYDRLALYDSLTTAFMVWALLLEVLLVQTSRLDVALLLGFAIGGGLLTKSSARFAIYLLPFSLLLFNWRPKPLFKRLAQWFGLALVAVLVALLFESIIKLSPAQHMVAIKNKVFIVPFNEFFMTDAWARFRGNLGGLTNWFTAYFTWPWLIGLIPSLIWGLKKSFRKTLLLFGWFIGPYLALAAFGLILYPRFILFMIFPLLIILGFGMSELKLKLKNRLAFIIPSLAFLIYAAYFSFRLLTNPILAPLPSGDKDQFINDWPAGYGVNEVVTFLKQESQTRNVFVATEGTFGLTPSALEIYLQDHPNITIKGFWPVGEHPEEIFDQVKNFDDVYILFKDSQNPPERFPGREIELVAKYRKGDSNIFMNLYRIKHEI